VSPLGRVYAYALADEPPEVRERFEPDVTEIAVTGFAAEAPRGWEPTLDDEHVEARWLSADQAIALLFYPEPREAIRRAAA